MPAAGFASAAEAAGLLDASLDYLAGVEWPSLGAGAHGEMLGRLQRAQARLIAVNAAVLAAFTAQGGYEPDGHRSARAWLVNRTGISKGAAGAAVGWHKRLARHQRIAQVMAAGDISESWAREIAGWTDKLPAGKRDEADQILLDAAGRGLPLEDLAVLVDLRRPWGAIDLLVTMLHALGGAVEPDVDLVESALMSAATGPSDDSPRAPSLSREVGELLDYLERSGSDIETRARLEFLYAHLLQHTRTARALSEVLGTDPALFAEILSYIYYAEGEPRDGEVSPERRAIAMAGYTVIREWHTPPGVRPDGIVDADALRSWVTEARRLLAESGRTTIADLVIGEVLTYFPPDPDGLWPAEPVRDLIEDLASPKLEEGLHTGRFNSRGITFRNPADGGAQERQLAAQHRGWADRVSDRWPRTGALLRRMADRYDEWARREDDQSEGFGDDGS